MAVGARTKLINKLSCRRIISASVVRDVLMRDMMQWRHHVLKSTLNV